MNTRCIITLAILFLFSCSKDRKEDLPQIHVKIYKTNADYFNYVNIWGEDHDHASNVLISNRLNIENGDTIFKYRWKLEQGYVADYAEIWHSDYFTNVSFQEILRYNELYEAPFPFDSMETRIIDKDSFIEFYVDDQDFFYRMPEDIEELNEIIRNGDIEKYLQRLK